jgi:MFS transporter, OPA family, solute carrier family 37 (glycerol-3-phosphate transporter), member 1/2
VFTMLMAAALLAGLLLTKLVCSELKGKVSSSVTKNATEAQRTFLDEV